MLKSQFTEDIFVEFQEHVMVGVIEVQNQDFAPILSIGDRISLGEEITQNQASYVVRLLEKYKNLAKVAGLDYKTELANPQWKKPFRVLDLTKKIYVEKNSEGKIEICLKFPFQLKKEFDEEMSGQKINGIGAWDAEEKVRRINFLDVNLIPLYEFANKRNFEIDESFLELLAEVEEIWQSADDLIPRAYYSDGEIKLINASEETNNYFKENITGSLYNNMLLAKSMGYPMIRLANSPFYNLLSSPENAFWVKTNELLFDMFHKIDGKVCIVLDRTSNVLEWLQNFVSDADKCGVSREDIKVCFRENKVDSKGLNEWVKEEGVGGKVDNGRIFIFETKPAKWLFKDSKDVKIVVTNSLYPATNHLTRDLISSHPCVIYLGDIKATAAKGQKIVEL